MIGSPIALTQRLDATHGYSDQVMAMKAYTKYTVSQRFERMTSRILACRLTRTQTPAIMRAVKRLRSNTFPASNEAVPYEAPTPNHSDGSLEPMTEIHVSEDGGANWNPLPEQSRPEALPKEGCFAASGTCLVARGEDDVWFCTGGAKVARVFRSSDRGKTWTVADVPLLAGIESAGAFSLAFRDSHHGMVVGRAAVQRLQPWGFQHSQRHAGGGAGEDVEQLAVHAVPGDARR